MRRLLFVAVISGCASPTPTGDLVISLESSKDSFAAEEPIALDLVFENTTDAPVRVLSYHTPFHGIESNLFEVTRNGLPVAYEGMIAKRAEPEDADYLVIEPGESLRGSFDPSLAYDITQPGHYEVRLRTSTGAISFDLVGAERLPRKPAPPDPGFAGCDSAQKASLQLARSNATVISGAARDYLHTNTSDSANVYRTWFDASGDQQGRPSVTTHFDAINDAFSTQNVTFNCKCKQRNVYAFVNAGQPYLINLCGAFWPAPDLGTDSKAGTLVHEMSHFYVVASTSDWAYGTAAAMNLAQTDWTKATTNADNHEYFAEHQP